MDRRTFITSTAALTAMAGTGGAAAEVQPESAPFPDRSPEARMLHHLERIEYAAARARAELLKGVGSAAAIHTAHRLAFAIEVSAMMVRSDARVLAGEVS